MRGPEQVVSETGDDLEMHGWRACDACGERPLAGPAEGLLSISGVLLDERRAAFSERQAAAARGETVKGPPPALVPWDWGHRDCFPDREPEYSIPGDRIDSLPKLMGCTLELLDATWFLETAWEDAVRRFYAIPFE